MKIKTTSAITAVCLFLGQSHLFAQGGNQNASGWEKVGNQVRLIDTTANVNVGNHLATEKIDINGNLRVREMTDLPQNNAANAQLKFRSIFADNTGKFYKGPELMLPKLPIELPDPALNPGGNAATDLWQPNGTSIVWTNRKVGIGLNSPSETLEVEGTAKITGRLQVGNNSLFLDPAQSAGAPNSIYSDNGNLLIQSNTGNIFNTILNGKGGKVGIGTTEPSGLLHLSGVNQATLILEDRDEAVNDKKWCILHAVDAPGHLQFQSLNDDNTVRTKAMTLSPAGNVGIGVINPAHILTVKKDQPAYTYIVADNVYSPASAGVGSGFAMAENNLIAWYLRSERDGSGRFNIGNPSGNKLTIQDNGNVGIGTTNPHYKLHLHEPGTTEVFSYFTNDHTGTAAGDGFKIGITDFGVAEFIQQHNGSDIRFKIKNSSGNIEEALRINENGKVSIGTTNTPGSYLLYVKGGILTEKVRSAVVGEWSDHALAKDYLLPSLLGEVEPHIQKHGHLIGVPSAKEVVANGVDMVEMDATLLLKIEELTLYAIEQQKMLDAQQKQIKKLEKEMKQRYYSPQNH